jgi:integrase
MPFEQRVVFGLATHQAPREGEIAGMSWERIHWDSHGWTIAQSWEGSTKNGKTRWQALIPRSERLLQKWWELQGRPETGIVFPAPRAGRKVGPNAAFVLSLDEDIPATEVSARAAKRGFRVSVQHVHVIRSAHRHLRDLPAKRYAKGHDWGWADRRYRKKGKGPVLTSPGWRQRLGIETQARFHDLRDTAATHLLSGTWGPAWSMTDVSKHLGHSSIAVTEQRYAHLTQDAKRRAAQSIESEPRRAAHGPHTSEVHLPKYLKTRAPEEGLEPTTNRLTAAAWPSESAGLQAPRPISGPTARTPLAAAVALVDAVASGSSVPGHLAAEMVDAVLGQPHVALALTALQGGPNALDRALELARLIVGQAATGTRGVGSA